MKQTITFLFLILGTLSSFSQYKISGKITDENNQSLPFANIILFKIGEEEKPSGTVSDDNGNFSLENINSGTYKLEISMLGFKSHIIKEFELNVDKVYNVVLIEETQSLNEVVVKVNDRL